MTSTESSAPLPRNRRTAAFERRVAEHLVPTLGQSERVLVASSGGPDSTAAMVASSRVLPPASVVAAHFDHRLRASNEVRAERELVAAVAQAAGVTMVAGRSPSVPESRAEEVAREARYRWLARSCHRVAATVCVTGHTMDDQAETVILRLARGTSAAGALGMAVQAPWPITVRGIPNPRLLRPLLTLTRVDVLEYLDALGIEAAEDPSNATVDYARNRVRNRVITELRQVNARAPEHLARFADQQREDESALTQLAHAWLQEHATVLGNPPHEAQLDRQPLRAAPPAIALRAIREAAAQLGIGLETVHLRGILANLERNGAVLDLPLARSETSGMILRLRLRPSPTGTD